MEKGMVRKGLTASALLGLSIASSMGYAAEGFKVRFPLSGSLGGEMLAPITPGVFGSVVATSIDIDKITGNDGDEITGTVAGQLSSAKVTTALSAFGPGAGPAATAMGAPLNYSGTARVSLKQKQQMYNIVLGYTTKDNYADGHLTFAINIPYITIDRNVAATSTTPHLMTSTLTNGGANPIGTDITSAAMTGSFGPAPTPLRAIGTGLQAGFATQYQAGLGALANNSTGQAASLGDTEISALWSRQLAKAKIAFGATLVVPTGSYDSATTAINTGYGKFYTIRTGGAIAYKATENLTLGTRVSLAFNTKNTDNNWRSGNYYVVDMAAAYKTPIGAFGPHIIRVEQYQNDVGSVSATGGSLGTNRFSSTGAGIFFTTLVPGINAGLNLSYMKTLESKNALSGSFIQARLSKVF